MRTFPLCKFAYVRVGLEAKGMGVDVEVGVGWGWGVGGTLSYPLVYHM